MERTRPQYNQGQRPPQDKTEEVLKEVSFLSGNDKWSGKVQILRVKVTSPDGSVKTFINKRLVLNSTGRFINLPRNGIDEIVSAIQSASESEREYNEALMEELNLRHESRPFVVNNPSRGGSRDYSRGNNGYRKSKEY